MDNSYRKKKINLKNNFIINNNDYSYNQFSFLDREIDNLNKKNEEIFKIIYKNSKLFRKDEKKM